MGCSDCVKKSCNTCVCKGPCDYNCDCEPKKRVCRKVVCQTKYVLDICGSNTCGRLLCGDCPEKTGCTPKTKTSCTCGCKKSTCGCKKTSCGCKKTSCGCKCKSKCGKSKCCKKCGDGPKSYVKKVSKLQKISTCSYTLDIKTCFCKCKCKSACKCSQ